MLFSCNRHTGVFAAAALAVSCGLGHAATISYTFEGSTGAATGTTADVSASTLTLNSLANAAYVRWTSTTATPADTTIVRGLVPGDITNSTAPTSTSVDYVELTLTPSAGKTLSFVSSALSFDYGTVIGTGTSGGLGLYVQPMYQIGSGSFVNLGSVLSNTTFASTVSSFPYTGSTGTGGTTAAISESSSGSISLAGITGLTADQTVTIRLAIGDNSNSTIALSATTNVKAAFLDNIVVSDVVPEPASLALLSLSGLGVLRRRRAVR